MAKMELESESELKTAYIKTKKTGKDIYRNIFHNVTVYVPKN